MARTEQNCKIVCRTTYLRTSILWHEGVNKDAKIVTEEVTEEGFTVNLTRVESEGRSFPVTGLRTGLDGRVITLHVRGECGEEVALYTDILVPGETDTAFLTEYGSGKRQRRC